MSKSKRKSSQYKMKVLEEFLKVSNSKEEYKLDPVNLKCFLTNEEYEAVAEMLDLPPLEEINHRTQAHGSLQLSKRAVSTFSETKDENWDMRVNLGSDTKPNNARRYLCGNPYLKFIRNPEKYAAKWRKPEPMKAKDILNASTVEKSKFITDKIIGDFIKWRKSICDNKEVEIDEKVLSQLFDIGIKKPDTVKIFRRKLIPRDIFEPKMMKRESKSWKQVKKHIGKTLTTKNIELQKELDSKELKQSTTTESVTETKQLNTRSKSRESDGARNLDKNETETRNRSALQLWSKCEVNMSDIVSSVWRNKLNYKCVQAFCKYLDQNPQIKKPEYLIEMNMFSGKTSE